MSNDLDIFLQRLVDQDTILQQTAEAIKMCAERDQFRNIQKAEIAILDRLEKKSNYKLPFHDETIKGLNDLMDMPGVDDRRDDSGKHEGEVKL